MTPVSGPDFANGPLALIALDQHPEVPSHASRSSTVHHLTYTPQHLLLELIPISTLTKYFTLLHVCGDAEAKMAFQQKLFENNASPYTTETIHNVGLFMAGLQLDHPSPPHALATLTKARNLADNAGGLSRG